MSSFRIFRNPITCSPFHLSPILQISQRTTAHPIQQVYDNTVYPLHLDNCFNFSALFLTNIIIVVTCGCQVLQPTQYVDILFFLSSLVELLHNLSTYRLGWESPPHYADNRPHWLGNHVIILCMSSCSDFMFIILGSDRKVCFALLPDVYHRE